VVPVFADTKSEHPDLYRFLDDLENKFDQKIERLSEGHDIWDVFFKSRMIKVLHAGGACKASIELKHKPLAKHFERSGCSAIAVGIEGTEGERIRDFKAKIGHVLFPLACRPLLSECDIKTKIQEMGIKLPQLYHDNYSHNNCAGFCVLAGIGQWAENFKRDPEMFSDFEQKEQKFIELVGYEFSILRDQRGGTPKPYTLKQLREDVESGREFGNDWRSQCLCMTPQPRLFSLDDCF
jgi:hypothetical protein